MEFSKYFQPTSSPESRVDRPVGRYSAVLVNIISSLPAFKFLIRVTHLDALNNSPPATLDRLVIADGELYHI